MLGIASSGNAEWLRAHGVVPVEYGDGLADRLRQAAPDGVDAFIDLFGPDYVQLAVDLGVPPERVDTIISFAKAAEVGAKTEGSAEASMPAVLSEIANWSPLARSTSTSLRPTRWTGSPTPSKSSNNDTPTARSCCCPEGECPLAFINT